MQYDKQYNDQRELVMLSFNNYLSAANDLFNARKTSNEVACRLLENHLDERWEEWQLATNNLNDLLIRGSKDMA